MPDKAPAAITSSAKAGGFFAYFIAILDFIGGIPIEKWVSAAALVGAVIYGISLLFEIRRKRLQIKLIEQQIEDHSRTYKE